MNYHYSLKQLKTFLQVARLQSISRSAEILHVTQPAISMQIKQLEETFGVALFEPQGRNIRLTPAGEDFNNHCLQVMASLKNLEAVMSEHAGSKRGQINLAIVSTAKYFTPEILAAFNLKHPDIKVNLFIDNKEAVFRQLERAEVDLVISGRVPSHLDCEKAAFAENHQSFVAHPGHPLVGDKTISYQQLAEQPFIIREQGSGTRDAVEQLFTRHQVEFKAHLEFPSNEVIKHAVMANMGISFLSQSTIATELRHGYLKALKVEGPEYISQWQLAHLKSKILSPALQVFKHFLLEKGTAIVNQKD